MNRTFCDCHSLKEIHLPDLSTVTNIKNCFSIPGTSTNGTVLKIVTVDALPNIDLSD